MAGFGERIIGASKLDSAIYEEVENDPNAMGQAIAVIILSSVAAGIGMARQVGAPGLFGALVAALVGWLLWAWITYFIGTRLLPAAGTHADWGQLLRTTGFAAAPGLLRFIGIVPGLNFLVFTITGLWLLAGFVVAVRQALDYTSTWRALGVCLIGFIVFSVLTIFLRVILP